jgi:hypothetical protein
MNPWFSWRPSVQNFTLPSPTSSPERCPDRGRDKPVNPDPRQHPAHRFPKLPSLVGLDLTLHPRPVARLRPMFASTCGSRPSERRIGRDGDEPRRQDRQPVGIDEDLRVGAGSGGMKASSVSEVPRFCGTGCLCQDRGCPCGHRSTRVSVFSLPESRQDGLRMIPILSKRTEFRLDLVHGHGSGFVICPSSTFRGRERCPPRDPCRRP